jgi:hypothetical protein
MINEIFQISPANPQIYNSQEVIKLYQNFFKFYSEDTSESKEKSKEKFSEICKNFKIQCGFNDETSADEVLKKVVENREFAEFVMNNLKILYPDESQIWMIRKVFGLSTEPELRTIFENERMENLIRKITFESPEEQSFASLPYKEKQQKLYEQDKIKLLEIINPQDHEQKKLNFKEFINLLKECSRKEVPFISGELEQNSPNDTPSISKILEKSDFLKNLDCFEIKDIVDVWDSIVNVRGFNSKFSNFEDFKNPESQEQLDNLEKFFKLSVHKAVKESKSFELINQEKALTEGDFDPIKLSDLKTQLNIVEPLNPEGLMKLFFTLKYFGEENNFISAIRPEKISQNPLLNYNLKFNDEELKHITIVRTLDPNSKESKQRDLKEVREGFFKKLEEGDRHFCTAFFRSEFFKGGSSLATYSADHGIVADLDLPNAGHFAGDFWSEHFSFSKSRRFEGQDVSRLRAFGENRNLLTFALTQCKVTPHLLKFESNLNPHTTFRDKFEEYLFDKNVVYSSKFDICWPGYYQQTRYDKDQISDQTIFDLGGQAIRAGSKLLYSRIGSYRYNESNVYLNLSDINGLAVIGSDLNNFIDLFTETSLERKGMLEKSDKFDHEIDKIKWQKEVFCKDVEKILEEKLEKLKEDFTKLTDKVEGRCNPGRAEVLCKYSGAYFDFSPSSLLIDQDREFYDKDGKILSHLERFKMINPQNISIHLRSLIEKTEMDLEYVKALSSTPDPEEVKKKLQRDLKIYDNNTEKITLMDAILNPENEINLLKLFSNKDEKTTEKFKIFVQQLAFEGFYKTVDNPDTAKEFTKLFLKKQIDFVAKNLDIDLQEQIDIGEKKLPFEFAVTPIKINPTRQNSASSLPAQLVMGGVVTESLQQAVKKTSSSGQGLMPRFSPVGAERVEVSSSLVVPTATTNILGAGVWGR